MLCTINDCAVTGNHFNTYQHRQTRRYPARENIHKKGMKLHILDRLLCTQCIHETEAVTKRFEVGSRVGNKVVKLYRTVRVLEELPGLIVGAHPLHANLLQGGGWRVDIPLLTCDHWMSLLFVQKHWRNSYFSAGSHATNWTMLWTCFSSQIQCKADVSCFSKELDINNYRFESFFANFCYYFSCVSLEF